MAIIQTKRRSEALPLYSSFFYCMLKHDRIKAQSTTFAIMRCPESKGSQDAAHLAIGGNQARMTWAHLDRTRFRRFPRGLFCWKQKKWRGNASRVTVRLYVMWLSELILYLQIDLLVEIHLVHAYNERAAFTGQKTPIEMLQLGLIRGCLIAVLISPNEVPSCARDIGSSLI